VNVVFRGEPVALRLEAPAAPRIALASDNSPDLLARILGAMAGGAEVVLQNTRLTEAERAAQLDSIAAFPPAGAPATILFTSGTTGTPKAALLPLECHLAAARAANEVLRVEASSRLVCALPMFHVGGLAIAFRCQLAGATLLLHERFDARAVARDLLEGATHASLVANSLARVLEVCDRFPPSVRAVLIGGGPIAAPLLERAQRAGLPVLESYGMTETASMITCEGVPLPGMEARVVGGEIEVRGPALMRGYLGHQPVSGWFRTGDLGSIDSHGRLVVHARRGDLIISGGENVYPAEVEGALLAHPDVREAAVLPAPDERWGQVGIAYVSGTVSENMLRDFLRERLARYKIPARFIFLEALPRNAAGKVDRARLVNTASDESSL
jgi:O-succinylbenzoic acid--CoA ligase